MNGLEREKAGRGAGRRPRGKENKLNGNGNGVHVEEVSSPPQLNDTTTIPEPTKPSRPKKMELELRIDDNSSKEKDKDTLERNIDNVIFGEVTFKAWYPSWYPKEIIGEKALTVGAGDKGGIVVTELYVCKRCFGYGKVLVDWVRHCRCCEREVPGRKVYVHGGWREDDTPRPAVGEWSIWEVDGGVETLFCQNLSLFAKLFLDNKSVFFDVSGFNYFLLVYTPPLNSPHNTTNPSQPPQKQIIGFFSKEKLSWDNNNLACILIFPPWQRKGLGALLMGVSYAIARREQILGGPEKPISDLGRKGYKRFWGAEIARWILERPDERKKKGKGKGRREEVGIRVLSEETWIAQEDCLGVLRDMDVVERIGGRGRLSAGSGGGDGEGDGKEKDGKEKFKVRIDKEAVRRWCERERIKLERVVTEEGFMPGYAERVEDVEEDEGEVELVEEEEVDEEMGG
ncbi:acyl-CoA N-acyltransferase [Rhexocercosporidium sp. MPI-PUGE-AT-0058]|nr:acyl-CoA N-acyltransferase [Rhexocercosporidium sp. MPI-PUGE-AT-0058]